MRSERLVLTGDPAALAATLRALVPAPATVHEAVAEIIAAVRSGGDAVVLDYARPFDTSGAEPGPLIVTDAELEAAIGHVDQDVLRALEQTAENIARVAQASLREDHTVGFEGHEIRLRQAPVAHAAIYVPGGRAPYP